MITLPMLLPIPPRRPPLTLRLLALEAGRSLVALVLLDTSAAILLFVTGENYPIGFVIRDVLRVPFVLIVVFLPLSNRYFAGRGRPEWQIEDAEDAAEAEKAAKAARARARKS